MQIEQTRVMRGPNYWAPDLNKLIVLKVKVDQTDVFENSQAAELAERLAKLTPAVNLPAGYTNMAELVGLLAIELQCMAGLPCTYTKVQSTSHPDVLYVVFAYEEEHVGVYAADAALRLAKAIRAAEEYKLEEDLNKLKQIYRRYALGPSTKSIADEALKRGIPVTRLDRFSWMMLGQGSNQQSFRSTVASTTSNLAVELVSNKDATKKVLADNFLPVPQGRVVDTVEELQTAAKALGYPLVIKPLNGNHGNGITTDITCQETLLSAFEAAKVISDDVIIERHISGSDYRFLVINFKLVAVAKRIPARVTGDGTSTIRELVDEVNKDPRRGVGHEMELTAIKFDAHTKIRLESFGLTPESVLPAGEVLDLKDTANISTGGTAEDVTDSVHPENVFLAERVARLLNLDICGIDIVADSVERRMTQGSGAILEVNAGPGLRMHLAPTIGTPRNVAAPIVDLMFPNNAPSRIPVIAITGTNGKTTTTRLIAHLAKYAGYNVGFTTTDGIYIRDRLITQGDCSGPASASVIFRDPGVNFAVLECARGGILRAGLGFDHCDVSVVTNVSSDHLGISDVETVEQLARIKSVVPRSTKPSGHAILNADDDLVYNMSKDLSCNIALFSLDPQNPRILEHVQTGNLAAVVDNGHFTIMAKGVKMNIAAVASVPLTMGGKAECMTKNILPALLTAYLYNFPVQALTDALMSFIPSPENTPGRMNEFIFKDFKMIVDYAHNQGGFAELKKYAEKEEASVKVGIITCPGDRLEEDVITIGRQAAEIFDEIIIRHDKDGRGRPRELMTELLMTGIKQVDPNKWVIVISDEKEAVQYAIDHARFGSWIFVNTEKVFDTLQFVAAAQERQAVLTPVQH
jgi:cyanophycin synthetase